MHRKLKGLGVLGMREMSTAGGQQATPAVAAAQRNAALFLDALFGSGVVEAPPPMVPYNAPRSTLSNTGGFSNHAGNFPGAQ